MALTPEIRAFQAGTSVLTEASPTLRVSQAGTLILAIWPAEFTYASQAGASVLTEAQTTLRAAQAGVLILARGRVVDPSVRVWGFPLDEHEMFVIRLGNEETLVVDITTGQFYNWGSGDSSLWRAYDGCVWFGGAALGSAYKSNIVVGDDGNGSLYFLDPEGDTDDDAILGQDIQRPFRREATGQVPIKGYSRVPCYRVELLGSIGQLTDDTLTEVTLQISDDRGASYVTVGTVSVDQDDFDARIDWRSVGSMRAPGRLFRIRDYGALRRIDSLDMPGEEDG